MFRYRYGYRLERIEKITDPLKRIELFKAITSPAYIIATLENVHDVSSEFFCPVKKCFEFACEASAKSKAMPEYKREYQEIEHRWVIQHNGQFWYFDLLLDIYKLTVVIAYTGKH